VPSGGSESGSSAASSGLPASCSPQLPFAFTPSAASTYSLSSLVGPVRRPRADNTSFWWSGPMLCIRARPSAHARRAAQGGHGGGGGSTPLSPALGGREGGPFAAARRPAAWCSPRSSAAFELPPAGALGYSVSPLQSSLEASLLSSSTPRHAGPALPSPPAPLQAAGARPGAAGPGLSGTGLHATGVSALGTAVKCRSNAERGWSSGREPDWSRLGAGSSAASAGSFGSSSAAARAPAGGSVDAERAGSAVAPAEDGEGDPLPFALDADAPPSPAAPPRAGAPAQPGAPLARGAGGGGVHASKILWP